MAYPIFLSESLNEKNRLKGMGGFQMVLSKSAGNLDGVSLRDLARKFFEWKSFVVHESESIQGKFNAHKFDFLVSQDKQPSPEILADIGVLVKDWARTCGINVILQFEQIVKDVRPAIRQGMLVGNQFSSSARSLAEKAGILLLSRGELISIYRTHQIQM